MRCSTSSPRAWSCLHLVFCATVLLLLLLGAECFQCHSSFSRFRKLHHKQLHRLSDFPNRNSKSGNDAILQEMEQEVLASAKAQVDFNQIVKALSSNNGDETAPTAPPATNMMIEETPNAYVSAPLPWQVSLAASAVSSVVALVLFQNLYVSLFCFVVVLAVSFKDPVDDDNLLGAFARILGRQTLKSYPTVKAVARAAVTGQEEVMWLKERIQTLEEENQELREWKELREMAEQRLPEYSVTELKALARDYGLPVGGTKLQLMVRVLENKALVFPELQGEKEI